MFRGVYMENDLKEKYVNFKNAIDLTSELLFFRAVQRNYKYIFEDEPLGSDRFLGHTGAKLFKNKELLNEPMTDEFRNGDRYQWINKIQYGYICRMLNEFMFEKMHLSEGEIARYFIGMTEWEKFLEYSVNFKELFVDLTLKIMGENDLSREFLDGRVEKSKVACDRAKVEATPLEAKYLRELYKSFINAQQIANKEGLESINMNQMYKKGLLMAKELGFEEQESDKYVYEYFDDMGIM